MTEQRRYTGRELTALLEQVREELGAEATIHGANKIRSGGVAGFFATEKFEVIASAGDHEEGLIDLGVAADPAPAPTAGGAATALLDRAEAISIQERIELSRPPQPRTTLAHERTAPVVMTSTASSTASTSRAPATTEPATSGLVDEGGEISLWFSDLPSNDFEAALDREVAQPSIDWATGDTNGVGDLERDLRAPEVAVTSTRADAFWNRVEEAERLVGRLDTESSIVIVVGNVRSALAVSSHFDVDRRGQKSEVVLMTDQTTSSGIPAWQVRRSMGELNDQLRTWVDQQSSGIVVIDSALGGKADLYIERARSAGSRLLRLAVDDQLTPRHIFNILQRFGGNVVVDLSFRAEPEHVLNLIDHGIPVASVDGRAVDPGLLMALRHEVRNG